MQVVASMLSSQMYSKLAKPVLFRFTPDQVHAQLLKVASRAQSHRSIRALLHGSWAYDAREQLGQEVCGINFANPVGLSAGFDKNFEVLPLMKAVGFGFMEGGSITYRPCTGNPRPWFHRLPRTKSIVVHAGLANQGSERIMHRLRTYPASATRGFPINISVAKTNSPAACSEDDAIADYIGSLRAIQSARVGDLITLNISCPNTYGGEPFTTADKLERLLGAVDEVNLHQPVFIKMPCHLPWPEFEDLLGVASRHAVAGVTISNLAKDRGRARLMDPLPESMKGNLSGKPTWELSNELIRQTYRHYGQRFTIIGVGGIFSAEDAYVKIRLGATLVELISGLIFEGPQLVGQINRGLAHLLERDGYTNISQAIGVDNRS